MSGKESGLKVITSTCHLENNQNNNNPNKSVYILATNHHSAIVFVIAQQ
jgi:hypothetical protein